MAPINYPSTFERFGFVSELLYEMATVFQNDDSRRLEELERAVADGNASAAAVASRALRGIASAFDARRAAEAAASIESRALLAHELPDRSKMQSVRSAFEEVAAALDRYSTLAEAPRNRTNSIPTPSPHGIETKAS